MYVVGSEILTAVIMKRDMSLYIPLKVNYFSEEMSPPSPDLKNSA
jgi:hypothetical protein